MISDFKMSVNDDMLRDPKKIIPVLNKKLFEKEWHYFYLCGWVFFYFVKDLDRNIVKMEIIRDIVYHLMIALKAKTSIYIRVVALSDRRSFPLNFFQWRRDKRNDIASKKKSCVEKLCRLCVYRVIAILQEQDSVSRKITWSTLLQQVIQFL